MHYQLPETSPAAAVCAVISTHTHTPHNSATRKAQHNKLLKASCAAANCLQDGKQAMDVSEDGEQQSGSGSGSGSDDDEDMSGSGSEEGSSGSEEDEGEESDEEEAGGKKGKKQKGQMAGSKKVGWLIGWVVGWLGADVTCVVAEAAAPGRHGTVHGHAA